MTTYSTEKIKMFKYSSRNIGYSTNNNLQKEKLDEDHNIFLNYYCVIILYMNQDNISITQLVTMKIKSSKSPKCFSKNH